MTEPSRLEIAYTQIRQKILQGDFSPGTLLSENELAAELDMSRTPIRTAISRLETEGYVESLKNRGILVKAISPLEVMELFELQVSLQLFVLDVAEKRQYTFDIQQLRDIFAEQQEATEAKDYLRYAECTFAFISSFIAIGRNQTMVNLIQSSKDKIIRAAVVNYRATPYQKHYSGTLYTEAMLNAIESNDLSKLRSIVSRFGETIRERAIMEGFSF